MHSGHPVSGGPQNTILVFLLTTTLHGQLRYPCVTGGNPRGPGDKASKLVRGQRGLWSDSPIGTFCIISIE